MNNKAHLRPSDYDRNGDIIPSGWKEEKGDLISRSALIKEINENHELFEKERVYLEGIVLNAPTVEAVPLDFHEKCMDKTVREMLERPQVVIFSEIMTEEEKQKLIAEFKAVMDNAKYTIENTN